MGRRLTAVSEGIKSIVDSEICVIIMMGEHGEQSIQSNLESYTNLDNVLNQFEKRKSMMMVRDDQVQETKPPTQIREIKATEIFVNKESLKEKFKKENLFLKTKESKLTEQELWKKDRKSLFENKEEMLERAIKEEQESRKNPLKLLEVYIKRIQRLCNKLLKVDLIAAGREAPGQKVDQQVDSVQVPDLDFHRDIFPGQ